MNTQSGLIRLLAGRVMLVLMLAGAFTLVVEMRTSQLQAAVFTWLAREMTFWLEPGPNPAARFSGSPGKRLNDVSQGREL